MASKSIIARFFFTLVLYLLSAQAQNTYATPGKQIKFTNAQVDSIYKEWTVLVDGSKYQQALNMVKEVLPGCEPSYHKGCGNLLYAIGYCYEYLNNNYDSAVVYYEKSYAAILKAKSLHDEVGILMRLNYIYYYVKKFKERDSLLVVIKRIVDTTKDINALAILNGSIGEYYLDNAAYESFIFYKLKAISYRKRLVTTDSASNRENIGVSYLQVVQAYNRMKQPEKAFEYLNYSKDYIRNFRDGEAFLYNEYTNLFLQKNNLDSANYYNQKLDGMMRLQDSLFINLSYQRRLYADFFTRNKNLSKAYSEAEEAIRFAKKSTDEGILIEGYIAIGKVLFFKKEYAQSIAYLSQALPNAYSFDKEMFVTIQKYLAQNYAAIGNWQEAYKHVYQYTTLQDTLYKEASKRTLAEVEARYQNKEKQGQIAVQKKALTDSRKARVRLTIGLGLLSLVSILLVVIYRIKKRTADALDTSNKKLQQLNEELEEANQTKAKLFSIISHDLRSPISQVYQFMNIQQANPDLLSEEDKTQFNSRIQTATGALLETMEDLLLWSKNQMNHFDVSLVQVSVASVVNHCLDLLQLNIASKQINVIKEIDSEAMVLSDLNFLQAIVRNLIQNALKAAPINSKVSIYFSNASLFIENEGGSFTQDQYLEAVNGNATTKVKSGLGLKLIAELSRKIGCTILFETLNEEKTRVQLSF